MHHEKVTSPAGVQKVLQFMTAEQELLNTKRTELIRQLRYLFCYSPFLFDQFYLMLREAFPMQTGSYFSPDFVYFLKFEITVKPV